MAQLFPRPHHSPDRWLRRLDGAAGRMNPALTLVAIGLVILNLTCLLLLAPHLPITHGAPGLAACPASFASGPGAGPSPTPDFRAWSTY